MALIESISRGMSRFRADVSGFGSPGPGDDFWYGPLGGTSATGMRVDPQSAKRVAAVLACVNIIARNVGMMPGKIFKDLANGGKEAVPSHPIYDLIATRPNNQQTAVDFRMMMQAHVELRGNAYARIVAGDDGPFGQLVPMHPDRVSVYQTKPYGDLVYKYNNPLTSQTDALTADQVFHLRGPSDNGILGESTIAVASEVFGVALAGQDFTARYFSNDARPGGLFEQATGTKFKDKVDEDSFVESWRQMLTGRNRHKTAIVPAGLTYKEIGVKPNDAQLLEARKFSRIEICSLFGVPPHLIGETEKTATYASVEQFNIMFAVQCLLPRIVMWEQTIQRDLIVDPKYYPKFSMAALLRGDTASRYASYQIAIQNGWMSQNDVRLLEDLNPIADGDTYWRPLNWAPLGQIAAPSQNGSSFDDTQPDDTTITDSNSTGSNDAASFRQRLQALAAIGAQRCVRKETAALTKMIERGIEAADLNKFYADHSGFIAGALNMNPKSARSYTDRHAELLSAVVSNGNNKASSLALLSTFERYGPCELATLAVEGPTQ